MIRRFLSLLATLAFLEGVAAAQQPEGTPQPPGGGAPDPEQLLQQAEKYYEALEYESALKTLILVHQVPGAQPMQRARSLLYMGVCFTALGNAENAVQSFMELLKLKPSFRLPPGISPSIQAMFKEALLRLKLPEAAPPESQEVPSSQPAPGGAADEVAVSVRGQSKVRAGEPVELKIEVTDPENQVVGLVIHWRRVGGPDYSAIRVKHQAGQRMVAGRIPGATVGDEAGKLHYLVEAVGRGGLTLAHAGTMESPFEVTLERPTRSKSRWGWWVLGIGSGAAVVGGIVTAILLTRPSAAPPPRTTADIAITIK